MVGEVQRDALRALDAVDGAAAVVAGVRGRGLAERVKHRARSSSKKIRASWQIDQTEPMWQPRVLSGGGVSAAYDATIQALAQSIHVLWQSQARRQSLRNTATAEATMMQSSMSTRIIMLSLKSEVQVWINL